MKAGVISFDQFRIDPANAVLLRGESSIILAPKPFQVLCHLIDRAGELVTKSELLDAVWPNIHVSESSLSFSINAIRIALGDDAKAPRYIQTVPRRGYRFIASVTAPPAPVANAVIPAISPVPSTAATARARLWVGRSFPLQILEAAIRQAVNAERQVVFITGEAGIGKSTLVDMALERAAGFGVLRGRCTELFGTSEAFLPLIEALQERCHGSDGPVLLKALRDHAPTWLAQMPGFLDVQDRAGFKTETFGANRERMLREFCDFMEFLCADRPWVIILEDLHWSDFATLDVLSRLARRNRRSAVLVLATYRPGDVMTGDHPVRTLHQDLQIHKLCTQIALDRLSQAELGQYLSLRFADSIVADSLQEQIFLRTLGQPLFLVSIVDYFLVQGLIIQENGRCRLAAPALIAKAGLPNDLREMITRQIDRLTPDERQILEIASAAGAEFSACLVAAGTSAAVVDVEEALEALTRKGHILMAAGVAEWPDGTISGRYAFQHALYQEVLYQRLAPAQLVRIHRRLGQRLEDGFQGQTMDIASTLARHFEGGRDFPKTVHYLGLAADSSSRRFGNREAINYLTRALGLVDRLPADDRPVTRIRLLQQRGWVRRAAGDFAGSIEDLNAMIAAAADAHQIRMEVSGLLDLSRFCLHSDRQQSLRSAELASSKSQVLNDESFRSLVQGSSASIRMYLNGWRDEDAELCRAAVRVESEGDDPNILVRRHGIDSVLKCMSADYRDCLTAATQVKALAQEAGDVYLFTIFNNLQSVALLHLGEWRRFLQSADAALAMAERNANRPAGILCRLMTAWLHVEALDFHGARARCELPEAVAYDPVPLVFFIRRVVLAKAYLGLGNHAAAFALFDQIMRRIEVDDTGTDYTICVTFHHAFCEYWLAVGDLPRAREQALHLHAYAAPGPDRNHLALAYRLQARIALAAGDVTDAATQASHAVSALEDTSLPHAAWRVYLTAGVCHQRQGDSAKAAGYRQRAQTAVQALADNFAQDEPLRAALLTGFSAARE